MKTEYDHDEDCLTIRPGTSYILLRLIKPLMWGIPLIAAYIFFPVNILQYLLILPLLLALFRYMKLKSISFELSEEQLVYRRGVLMSKTDFLELYRIKDFQLRRPFLHKLSGSMNIQLKTSDASHPSLELKGIPHSNILDIMRLRVEQARVGKNVYEVD